MFMIEICGNPLWGTHTDINDENNKCSIILETVRVVPITFPV